MKKLLLMLALLAPVVAISKTIEQTPTPINGVQVIPESVNVRAYGSSTEMTISTGFASAANIAGAKFTVAKTTVVLNGITRDSAFLFYGSDAARNGPAVELYSATDGVFAPGRFAIFTASGTLAQPRYWTSNPVNGGNAGQFAVYVSSGRATFNLAEIRTVFDFRPATNVQTTDASLPYNGGSGMAFYTLSSSSTVSNEKMRLTPDGKLEIPVIGGTLPGRLVVKSSTALDGSAASFADSSSGLILTIGEKPGATGLLLGLGAQASTAAITGSLTLIGTGAPNQAAGGAAVTLCLTGLGALGHVTAGTLTAPTCTAP